MINIEYKLVNNNGNLIEGILESRNLTHEKIDWLLNSNEENWEDCSNYTNMDRAYECLINNINRNKKIGILVDNDVDGMCSAAILYMFIKNDLQYDNVDYILHTKNNKAHGLTDEIMSKVLNSDVKLLITPDSSSENFKQQILLYEKNIDFIALDHHIYDISNVPKTSIVVNNKDGVVENIDGSGAAVTYKFISYVSGNMDIDIEYKYIDLVNLANISDVMDMKSLENRYIFNIGKQLDNIYSVLLNAFVSDMNNKSYLKIDDVIWKVSPVINAIVRNGSHYDRDLLFKAFIECEETVVYKYRNTMKEQSLQEAIIRIGNGYKRKQKELTDKAIKGEIKLLSNEDDKVVVIDANEIDTKVTGLVANKFMSMFNKPIVMVRNKKENKTNYTGSVRCPNQIESFKDICEKSKLFNWCQGHGNSFGYELPICNLDKFIVFVNNELKNIEFNNTIEVDYIFDESISMNDLIEIGKLEDVWCNSIKRPKFVIKNLKINTKDINKFGNANYSFMSDKILYKKDFCSKIFFSKMIDEDNNLLKNKDLKMDVLFAIKNNDKGFSYVDIIDVVSRAM